MLRKVPLVEGEYYHIYSRGVERRRIFLSDKDYDRFSALLYIMNQEGPFRMENFLKQDGHKLNDIYQEGREKTLVSVLSYTLMPNHFHLILYEHAKGGISKFMSKLLTAYSMYFNIKNERSGPLFTRPFRSEHLGNDPQFMYIFSYLHLNPLSIIDKDWKEYGIRDKERAEEFLDIYEYSSYQDYLGHKRGKSTILDFDRIPEHIKSTKLDFKTHDKSFRKYQ